MAIKKFKIEDYLSNSFYKKNPQMFSNMINFMNTHSQWWRSMKYNNDLMNWLNINLPLLNDKKFSISTKVYWIFNELKDFPKCKNEECCHSFNDRNVKSLDEGYVSFCSHKCAVNAEQTKEKAKNTCLKKYGTVSPAQNENVKKKGRKTCLDRYGVEYSFQSENNKTKTKKTLNAKYGVDHPMKLQCIKAKVEQTKQERYGDNQPWHSEESLEKRKMTWLNNYGVDHPMKSEKIKNDYVETTIEHYGVEHFSQSAQFKELRLRMSYEKIILQNEYDEPMFSVEEYLSRDSDKQLFNFRCKKCNNVFQSTHQDGRHRRCPICYPVETASSDEEKEVAEFIENLNIETVKNTRSIIDPLELDIYVPSVKLAVEFDGIYQHSHQIKLDAKYHLNKTLLCEKNKIKLIHIFEDEWIYKKDIVKSRLKNLLGIYDETVFARKCKVREIDSNTSREFQEKNHIQGAINAKVHLGLFYENELISLMTFGKSRFNKKYEWELLRFCNKLGYHIPGGASKLLKHFERTYVPKSLISYADRRWSQGRLYEVLGFQLDHASKPNYWYFQVGDSNLRARNEFQKHMLKEKLEYYDDNLTEQQNMEKNGFYFIYDCGNLVFTKTYV